MKENINLKFLKSPFVNGWVLTLLIIIGCSITNSDVFATSNSADGIIEEVEKLQAISGGSASLAKSGPIVGIPHTDCPQKFPDNTHP